MDGFDKEVLRRTPLGHATMALFSYTLSEPFLDELFENNRGRGYERLLEFPTFVYLIRDALLIHEGYGLPSFEQAARKGQLPVLARSVYPKLARMEMAVSLALLRESSLKMYGLFDTAQSPVPPSLSGFMVITLDGKTIKRVRRQLKSLRPLRGKLLGGKLIVAQDLATGMALAMNASQDAEVNEVRLAPQLVEQIRGMVLSTSSPSTGPGQAGQVLSGAIRLWMGDRQYSDLNLMNLFTQDGEHFLIRRNKTLGFVADPDRPAQYGTDAKGRCFTQEWGWVGGIRDKRRRYVRMITLQRPEADDDDVILLTDLLDSVLYPACDLLNTYLLRWGIEQMFQSVTEVFSLQQLIGCTPQANIFQASFCFVIYNAIQVVRGYVAQAGNVKPEEVSTAKLFDDVKEELIAQTKMGAEQAVAQAVEPVKTQEQMKGLLKTLLANQWQPRWRKTPTNPRYTRGRTQHVKSGRTNVFKHLQKHRLANDTPPVKQRQRR